MLALEAQRAKKQCLGWCSASRKILVHSNGLLRSSVPIARLCAQARTTVHERLWFCTRFLKRTPTHLKDDKGQYKQGTLNNVPFIKI